MTEFDDRLRASLSPDEREFLDSLEEERGLFQQLGDTFRGPMKGWTIFANIFVMIATGVGIWAIVEMLSADTVRGLILWAALGWAAWTMQIGLKQWLWDRMNLLSVLRELKKIELRIIQLEGSGR